MQRVITDRKEGKGLSFGSGFTHVTSLFWFQPWVPFFLNLTCALEARVGSLLLLK